jgi:hypothetical protein
MHVLGVPVLHTVWAVVTHHFATTTAGVAAYSAWHELPKWIMRMRVAVNRNPEKAEQLRANLEAMETAWRWPWQHGD